MISGEMGYLLTVAGLKNKGKDLLRKSLQENNYTEIKKTHFITIVLNVYKVLQVLKVNTLHVHTLYSFKRFILLLD